MDGFRPVTAPGVSSETMPIYGWKGATMRPFAMSSPDRFRPRPPIALNSEESASNCDEMKNLGGKDSTKRTQRHTRGRALLADGRTRVEPTARAPDTPFREGHVRG